MCLCSIDVGVGAEGLVDFLLRERIPSDETWGAAGAFVIGVDQWNAPSIYNSQDQLREPHDKDHCGVEADYREVGTAYRHSELCLTATRTCVRVQGDCAPYRIFGREYRDPFDRTWAFSVWEPQLKMGTIDCDLQVG